MSDTDTVDLDTCEHISVSTFAYFHAKGVLVQLQSHLFCMFSVFVPTSVLFHSLLNFRFLYLAAKVSAGTTMCKFCCGGIDVSFHVICILQRNVSNLTLHETWTKCQISRLSSYGVTLSMLY